MSAQMDRLLAEGAHIHGFVGLSAEPGKVVLLWTDPLPSDDEQRGILDRLRDVVGETPLEIQSSEPFEYA